MSYILGYLSYPGVPGRTSIVVIDTIASWHTTVVVGSLINGKRSPIMTSGVGFSSYVFVMGLNTMSDLDLATITERPPKVLISYRVFPGSWRVTAVTNALLTIPEASHVSI